MFQWTFDPTSHLKREDMTAEQKAVQPMSNICITVDGSRFMNVYTARCLGWSCGCRISILTRSRNGGRLSQ